MRGYAIGQFAVTVILTIIRLVAVLAFIVHAAWASAATDKVDLPVGSLIGIPNGSADIVSFKGIPYALPPFGDRRWTPASSGAQWTGIWRADCFGPDCIQISLRSPGSDYRTEFWFQPVSICQMLK